MVFYLTDRDLNKHFLNLSGGVLKKLRQSQSKNIPLDVKQRVFMF